MWKKIAYLLFVLFMMVLTLLGSMLYYGSKIYQDYEKDRVSDFQTGVTSTDEEIVDMILSDTLYLKEPVFTYVENDHNESGNTLFVKAFAVGSSNKTGYYFIVENATINDFQTLSGVVSSEESSAVSSSDEETTDVGPDAVFYGVNGETFKYDNWSGLAYDSSDSTLTGRFANFFISTSDIKSSLGEEITKIELESGVSGVPAITIDNVSGLDLKQTTFFNFVNEHYSEDSESESTEEFYDALDELNITLAKETPKNEAVVAISIFKIFKDGHFFRYVIIWMVAMLVVLSITGYYFIWRKKPGYTPSGKRYLREKITPTNNNKIKTLEDKQASKNVNMKSINNDVENKNSK